MPEQHTPHNPDPTIPYAHPMSAEEAQFVAGLGFPVPGWFAYLGEVERGALLGRPGVEHDYDLDYWLGRLVQFVPTPEFAEAIADRRLPGLFVPDAADRDKAMLDWHYHLAQSKTVVHNSAKDGLCDLAEFDPFLFVRHMGGQACAVRFDSEQNISITTMDKFAGSYRDKFVKLYEPKKGWQYKPAVPYLMQRPATWRFDTAEFLPGKPQSGRTLNLWRGWPYQDPKDAEPYDTPAWPAKLRRMQYHVEEVMCQGNQEHADWLLLWVSHALQRPWENSDVSLVLYGPQGSGKDCFCDAIGHLFAGYHVRLDQPGQLTSSFNAYLERALWVVASEGFFAKRSDADVLKNRITSPTIRVEHKGLNSYEVKKSFRVCITTNHLSSVHVEGGDRRFFTLLVDAEDGNLNPEYHGPLRDEWWLHGGAEEFFHWMRGPYWQRRLVEDAGRLRRRPTTAVLQEQRLLSLDGVELAVHNLLVEGRPPCRAEVAGQDRLFLPTLEFVRANRLPDRDLTRAGRLLTMLADGSERRLLEGVGQVQGKVLVPLVEARKRWEAHLKQPVAWDVDVQQWTAGGAILGGQ